MSVCSEALTDCKSSSDEVYQQATTVKGPIRELMYYISVTGEEKGRQYEECGWRHVFSRIYLRMSGLTHFHRIMSIAICLLDYLAIDRHYFFFSLSTAQSIYVTPIDYDSGTDS